LNQREEEAKKAKVEAVQRRKQAAEEEEIKEAGRRMLAEAQKRAAAAASASASQSSRSEAGSSQLSGQNGSSDPQPPISPEDLTIILQFPSTSTLPSTPPTLQPLLEGRYGPITHLIISEPPDTNGDTGKKKKKKKTGRKAVVEFKQGNWGGCWACWKDHMDGAEGRRLEDGVKARWAKGETPEWVAWADRQRQTPGSGNAGPGGGVDNGIAPAPRAPAFGSAPNLSTRSMADLMAEHAGRKEQKKKEEEFENMTLFRMRQAERDKLAEQIRLEEEES
jgi:DnaJ family protein C protein 17